MRIGILTYHRAENYGALLQSYALKTYLEQRGYDVSFVDYWPEYHNDYFRIFPRIKFRKSSPLMKAYCLYMLVVWGWARLKRKRTFTHFISEKLGIPSVPKYNKVSDVCSEFDLVFYGRDQIWRKQGLPGFPGRDLWYFGSSNVVARKVAYAASVGASCFEESEQSEIKRNLSAFHALSVREESLQESLEVLGISSTLVADPVFLLQAERWRELSKESNCKKGRSILVYNLLDSPESEKFAKKLAKKRHLPIREITKVYGFNKLGRRYIHGASVQEFLSLIANAEIVVSNSFHGVAFSILFQKQFYAVGMGTRADRVRSLLGQLGIENRYISGDQLEAKEIDYSVIADSLNRYRAVSESFIEGVLTQGVRDNNVECFK